MRRGDTYLPLQLYSTEFEMAGPVSLAPLRRDEAVGNVLDTNSPLGNIENEMKSVVIPEINGLTVHVQEDCRCQPSQALVAINQRMVRDDRMQESGRFELDGRVGVIPESTRLRSGNGRIQET